MENKNKTFYCKKCENIDVGLNLNQHTNSSKNSHLKKQQENSDDGKVNITSTTTNNDSDINITNFETSKDKNNEDEEIPRKSSNTTENSSLIIEKKLDNNKEKTKKINNSLLENKKESKNDYLEREHSDHEQESKVNHLEHKHSEHEHSEHEHGSSLDDPKKFKKDKIKLIVSWILLIPLLLAMLGNFGVNNPVIDFFGNPYFQFSITTIIFALLGMIFWKETINDAKEKRLSVDVLVTISTTFAYVFSVIFLIIGVVNKDMPDVLFFDAASEILVIIFTGRFIEVAIKKRALTEIDVFKNILPDSAIKIDKNNKKIEVDSSELIKDDIVFVKKGDKVPTDGIIIEGTSIILESSFTGEVDNFPKTIGDNVIGGTVSTTGELKIKVTEEVSNSVVSKILEGIKNTKNFKAKTQNIADKVASILIPSVFFISIIALLGWGFFGEGDQPWMNAIKVMITIMVIACPCSLGLTTPTSILVGTSVASNLGIFYNSKDVFENFKKADKIVFDKTGTITSGEIKLVKNTIPKEYLSLIKQVESNFVHPIAKAIVEQLQFEDKNNDKILDFTFEEEQSFGIKINFENKQYFLGSQKFVAKIHGEDFTVSQEIIEEQNKGNIVIFFFDDTTVIGFLALGDSIKETTFEAISDLKAKGIEVYMITGDNQLTANYIANQVGIKEENVFAEQLPHEKSEIVKKLQEGDKTVLFVGDGNNDTLAMKQSDLSISMNSGSEVAIQLSDVTIIDNDLNKIVDVLYISNKLLFNIYRGFGISITYNAIAIPIAVSGIINPMLAAIFMMLSDIIALINASTLRLILYKEKYRKQRRKVKDFKKQQNIT